MTSWRYGVVSPTMKLNALMVLVGWRAARALCLPICSCWYRYTFGAECKGHNLKHFSVRVEVSLEKYHLRGIEPWNWSPTEILSKKIPPKCHDNVPIAECSIEDNHTSHDSPGSGWYINVHPPPSKAQSNAHLRTNVWENKGRPPKMKRWLTITAPESKINRRPQRSTRYQLWSVKPSHPNYWWWQLTEVEYSRCI